MLSHAPDALKMPTTLQEVQKHVTTVVISTEAEEMCTEACSWYKTCELKSPRFDEVNF
jgi:hypothetical protein